MEQKYQEVPEILTSKDMAYLSDMFEWNKNGYKLSSEGEINSEVEDVEAIMKDIAKLSYNNLNTILNIIEEMGEEDE